MDNIVTKSVRVGSAGYYVNRDHLVISKPEAGNKVVASTEYYDLSGRRIVLDDTTKGMCIKVVKYTDGTSDAIKMMR